jgi:polyisoprenoid-binding protein YceI
MTARADVSAGIEHTIWRIDPARSSVEFHVKHFWGLTTVKGCFSAYHGRLDLSARSAVELTIEAAGLDTGNRRRDEHLRSPDFFDAERHPHVRFVSDSAALDGDRLTARGVLHARGTSMPLEIDATLRRAADELELESITVADHRRLGMHWNQLGMLRGPSRLMVSGRLVRDA